MRRLLSMLTPLGLFLLLNTPLSQVQAQSDVRIWEEDLVLPTYIVDPPEKSPMFFKNDSYQGASRVIYPYPLEDDFTNKKVDKTYRAVYLENDYLKVCVLPEIGGRLFYATDKTNGYEIFYRQHCDQTRSYRYAGSLDFWRNRILCVSPPSGIYQHAYRFQTRGERRWKCYAMDRGNGASPPNEMDLWDYPLSG